MRRAQNEITALIVAGGRGTRFGGVDKRLIVVDGVTIFQRQVDVLRRHAIEIVVAASDPVTGFRTVADRVAGAGPIAGIAAGLAVATTPWMLVLAGDMPDVDDALFEQLRDGAGHDAVGVVHAGRPEPLCCLLRVEPARRRVDALLDARQFKVSGLLEGLDTGWIEVGDARRLRNVNSPSDLGPSDPDGSDAPERA